jgi:hypothetical protein
VDALKLLQILLDQGAVPVIAPLGLDAAGALLNINADIATAAITATFWIAFAHVRAFRLHWRYEQRLFGRIPVAT